MGNKETYSRNQCSLVIRVDGEELEVPVNFGMTAQEIKAVYPYLLQMFNTKIVNPALTFHNDSEAGKYSNCSEEEYQHILEQFRNQSMFWYDKPSASALELAVRMAVDIKLRGISEVMDVFAAVTPADHIKPEAISDKEADEILKSTGMETPVDEEFDPGDEKDVAAGTAGDMSVDIYDTGDSRSSMLVNGLSDTNEPSAMSRFDSIVNADIAKAKDKYKSGYKAGAFDKDQIKDGLLDMYGTSGSKDSTEDAVEDNADSSPADDDAGSENEPEDEVPEDDSDDDEIPDDINNSGTHVAEPEFVNNDSEE